MSSFAVMDCNDCREAEELLRRLRDEHTAAPYNEQWRQTYRSLLHAWALMSVRLDDRRRQVAEECSPWFEVQQ